MQVCVLVFLILTISTIEACKANGKSYKNGEEWQPNAQFVMNCTMDGKNSWHTNIVACLTSTGKKVKLGEKLVEGDSEYTCATDPRGGAQLKIKTKVVTTQG